MYVLSSPRLLCPVGFVGLGSLAFARPCSLSAQYVLSHARRLIYSEKLSILSTTVGPHESSKEQIVYIFVS